MKTSSAIDTVLEQIRVCFKISIDCMDVNPEKRPTTRRIIELLEQTERMDEFNETDVQVCFTHALTITYVHMLSNPILLELLYITFFSFDLSNSGIRLSQWSLNRIKIPKS